MAKAGTTTTEETTTTTREDGLGGSGSLRKWLLWPILIVFFLIGITLIKIWETGRAEQAAARRGAIVQSQEPVYPIEKTVEINQNTPFTIVLHNDEHLEYDVVERNYWLDSIFNATDHYHQPPRNDPSWKEINGVQDVRMAQFQITPGTETITGHLWYRITKKS